MEQVNQAAALVGGEAIIDDGLLNEVANLVEMPTAVMGGFEKEFLSLPRDVLISVMKKHQGYFPVESPLPMGAPQGCSAKGLGVRELSPHFIAIRNGDDTTLILSARGMSTSSARVLPTRTFSFVKISRSRSSLSPGFPG